MTNGEKIQTILDIDKDCTEVYGKNGMMTFSVPQDWWEAEYEEPTKNESGPRKGHWMRVNKDKLRCSKCDVIHFIAQYPQGKIEWCPNCGSKNEVEE